MASADGPTDGPPDDQLVTATLAGDDHAYAELAARHKGRVFGLAARFARDAAELEDIAQEVFTQAYFKLRQYRRDSPFEHWLLRITTYKCYDHLRKRRRAAPHISVDAMLESGHEPSAPPPPEPPPHLERLHAAMAELSAKERLVLTLLELEDRTVQEVAELTGWSPQSPRFPRPRRPAQTSGELAMNDSNPDPLDALFATARAQRPDTSRAQFGFETRLMARLRERRQPDALSLWTLVTWRMVPLCAAAVIALALWNSDLAGQSDDATGAGCLLSPENAQLDSAY